MFNKDFSNKRSTGYYFNPVDDRRRFLIGRHHKFLFADLGANRFAKIAMPAPDFFGPSIGTFEIVGGKIILLALLTKLAVLPIIIIMLVATRKIKVLANEGILATLHESRTDWSMFPGSIFLFI
jgi:putative oxidoreductase